MTDLKKIIDKAVSGGWKLDEIMQMLTEGDSDILLGTALFNRIFSHDFLKAFFGEEIICNICEIPISKSCVHYCTGTDDCLPIWQCHAQKLVLSEDRIKYLMGFVSE